MTPSLDSLLAKGEIQSLDVHFARTMGRLAHETRPSVLMAAALVSRQVRSGHVCLPATALAELLGSPEAGGSGSSDAAHTQGRTVLQAAEILAQLKSSALVSDGSAATPLVLDGAGRLYLRRYWQHEQAVAARESTGAGLTR
ncbi:MAG: exodeoxyribonuclease V subunit alpha, partial [Acidobacteriota bacterium]